MERDKGKERGGKKPGSGGCKGGHPGEPPELLKLLPERPQLSPRGVRSPPPARGLGATAAFRVRARTTPAADRPPGRFLGAQPGPSGRATC